MIAPTHLDVQMSERDPWYFIKNFVRTFDRKGKVGKRENVPFPDWKEIFPPYLRHLQDQLQEYYVYNSCRVTATPKSRQMMVSWIVCAFGLWVMLFYPESEVVFQSKKEKDSRDQVIRFKYLYDSMPQLFKDEFPLTTATTSGQHSLFLRLSNGSYVEGVASGGDTVRSHTPTVLISDESAFQPDLADSIKAGKACAMLFILVSTPDVGEFERLIEDTDGENHNIGGIAPQISGDGSNQNEQNIYAGSEVGKNDRENFVQPVVPDREWQLVGKVF